MFTVLITTKICILSLNSWIPTYREQFRGIVYVTAPLVFGRIQCQLYLVWYKKQNLLISYDFLPYYRPGILKDIHKRFIMYQLLSATQYLHSGNVIHRDQKPSNILLDVECNCKIADFGLARSLSAQQTTGIYLKYFHRVKDVKFARVLLIFN